MPSDDFYLGLIVALHVLEQADQETYFHEIVRSVDSAALIRVARKNGDMRFSGLTRYGYGRKLAPKERT